MLNLRPAGGEKRASEGEEIVKERYQTGQLEVTISL